MPLPEIIDDIDGTNDVIKRTQDFSVIYRYPSRSCSQKLKQTDFDLQLHKLK